MIKNIERNRAICILGMHRSGTSTVARAFNLLGAYIGEEKDLLPPLPENPEGFWERLDIYYLQDRLLEIMKRDWAASEPLPENWHKLEEIRPFKNELVELVNKEFSGRPLWLWKDPRTCLLLPLWKDVLLEQGIDLQVVFVVRNPLDVARSLGKRNNFTLDKGMGIWFNFTISALHAVKGLDTVFLSYDRFLDDWETELKKCAAGLGIEWPVAETETELKSQMASFVRRDLRHSVSGLDELYSVNAPEPLIRLYWLLCELQSGTGKLNTAIGSMVEVVYQEYIYNSNLFDYSTERLEEMAASSKTLARLVEMQKALVMQTALLETVENNLQCVMDSISWKITKPLRSVHEILLRISNS